MAPTQRIVWTFTIEGCEHGHALTLEKSGEFVLTMERHYCEKANKLLMKVLAGTVKFPTHDSTTHFIDPHKDLCCDFKKLWRDAPYQG